MEAGYDFLGIVSLVIFVLLGLLSLAHWKRYGGEAGGWLAATFGSIAAILIVSRFVPEESESGIVETVRKVQVAILVLFPYFLYRFHLSFFKRKLRIWIPVHILTAVASFGVFFFGDLPEAGEGRTTAFSVYVVIVLVQWSTISAVVTWRFWRASRRQTTLVAFRLRMMGSGAALLALALVLAGGAGSRESVSWVDIGVQAIAVISALLFMLGFWAPRWIRRSLMYARQDPFEMTRSMTAFAPDREAMASRALKQGLELMSAEQGFITDPSGQVLAREVIDDQLIRSASTSVPEEGETGSTALRDDPRRVVLTAGIAFGEGRGCLGVVTGPYTPFFGPEELARLRDFANVTSYALERVRLRERLTSILDAIGDLGTGFVVTENGKFVSSNDAYLRLTGYSLEELRAMDSAMDVLPDEDRPEALERVRKRAAGEPVDDFMEARIFTKRGDIKHVEVAVKFSRLNDRTRAISLVRDISERMLVEKQRDRFISDAAHELRTPISMLLGFAELLNEAYPEDKQAEIRGGIERAGARIRSLIKNLLDLSRLQRGLRLELRSVRLDEMFRSALEASPPHEGVEVILEDGADLSVLTDPNRMDEVLSNLFTNAYRYGGPRVLVSATKADGVVSIVVEDNGPGVEEGLIPLLFEPFARGSTSSTVGGSGLGLAIARGVVEASGGAIRYEDGTPTGARFLIELPEADRG